MLQHNDANDGFLYTMTYFNKRGTKALLDIGATGNFLAKKEVQ